MGWCFDKTQVSNLGSRKLRLLCKVKYLLTNIRNVSHLIRRPHRSCSICSSSQSTSRFSLKSYKSKKNIRFFGTVTCNTKYENVLGLQMYRFYSTSNRETFKTEAPIGVCQNSMSAFRFHLFGLRLGESFNRLSRHVNFYFKHKQVSVINYGQCETQEPLTKTNRRVESGSGETRAFATEQVQDVSSNQPLTSTYPRLQLFHISSLANRFGESYIHVANHINSVFSRNPAKQNHMESTPSEEFRRPRTRKRRVMSVKSVENVQSSRSEIENNGSSSWEEGYLHFARHINQYFGAKVADSVEKSAHVGHQVSKSSDPPNKIKGTLQASSQGLFHMSSPTTRFGENYTYMANHINHYFKGSAASENEEVDGKLGRHREKPVSLFERLLKSSTIPGFVGSYLGMRSSKQSGQIITRTTEEMLDIMVVRRREAEEKTGVLLNRLEKAAVPSSITSCVEELNTHLIQHPACKAVVWQKKGAIMLLNRRRIFWMNDKLQEAIRETLALIGYVDQVKGCGIRVLSIDGGGTKGLVPLQVLKQLEAQTGKRVYQLFDYICGVSTGAVLAFMLGLARISLDECEEMYHRFGSDVFRQNPLVGTVKMGWTHSYYNTETWEKILSLDLDI